MKVILSTLAGLLALGAAEAATVDLINATPSEGKMIVTYQLINQTGALDSQVTTATLPTQVTIPDHMNGVRVTAMQNERVPTANHWFTFPNPGCVWTQNSGRPATLSFSTSAHEINCR